jgi:peptidoglycan-N-acetylglucosamine deacetylase
VQPLSGANKLGARSVMGCNQVQRVLRRLLRLSWSQVILFDIFAAAALGAVLFVLLRPQPKVADGVRPVLHEKRIAFSFDDVPRGAGAFLDVGQRPQMLIAALKEGGVAQAAFFANPGRISSSNKGVEAIAAYAAAGHVIANHTQNHIILSSVSAERFLADVDAAESWLKPKANHRSWLRFPQLDEGGSDKVKRDAVRAGLRGRGMRDGYVTADGWDWYMESQTLAAKRAGKVMDVAALRDLYIETHVQSAEFSDKLARRMFTKPPVQMLLLHETDLAAMFVDDLAKALRAKGWEIVPADKVYADPMAKMIPNSDVTNGTYLEMLAWEKGLKGNRWFPRNDIPVARKLFATRVLHE